MISAKEAYNLSAPRLDEYRSFLDTKIREAVKKREASITIKEDPYNMWLYKEDELEDMDAKRCIKELRELGYSIKQLYDGSGYFLNVGLIIDWSKK